jgi:hypothetical protein
LSCAKGRFHAAYMKGFDARLAGKPRTANPYPDKRTTSGNHVSYSRAWQRVWAEGWDTCDQVQTETSTQKWDNASNNSWAT